MDEFHVMWVRDKVLEGINSLLATSGSTTERRTSIAGATSSCLFSFFHNQMQREEVGFVEILFPEFGYACPPVMLTVRTYPVAETMTDGAEYLVQHFVDFAETRRSIKFVCGRFAITNRSRLRLNCTV